MIENEYYSLQDDYFKQKTTIKEIEIKLKNEKLEKNELVAQLEVIKSNHNKLELLNQELKEEVLKLNLIKSQDPLT